MQRAMVIALVLFFSGLGLATAASVSPEEAQKQNEFKKAFGNKDAADRVKAVQTLEGLHHPTTLSMLSTVVQADTDKDVRVEAFKLLAKAPARDGSLAQLLVSLFQAVKPHEIATKTEMASQMQHSEFKYVITEALVDFGSRMRYPDLLSNYGNTGQSAGGGASTTSGDPNVNIRRMRKEFEAFVTAFNEVTKAGLRANDKNSPAEFKKWWEQSRQKVGTADKELADKYRAEDQARREQPKKDEKKEEKKDKA